MPYYASIKRLFRPILTYLSVFSSRKTFFLYIYILFFFWLWKGSLHQISSQSSCGGFLWSWADKHCLQGFYLNSLHTFVQNENVSWQQARLPPFSPSFLLIPKRHHGCVYTARGPFSPEFWSSQSWATARERAQVFSRSQDGFTFYGY